MEVIHSRSPYFVETSASGLSRATLEIYVYEGVIDPVLAEPTFQVSATPVNQEGVVRWDISNLIYTEISKAYKEANTVWVKYRVIRNEGGGLSVGEFVQCYATLGYGYYEEGYNPQTEKLIPLSTRLVSKNKNDIFKLPLLNTDGGTISFFKNGVQVDSAEVVSTGTSVDIYKEHAVYSEDEFKNRASDDGGIYESNECITEFFVTYYENNFDQIEFTSPSGETDSLSIEIICESKYTPHRVYFMNKYGYKESLWFFKRSELSTKTKRDDYQSNNRISYSLGDKTIHQKKTFNLTGMENLKMNSGWVSEEKNESFRQLILSEYVWIDYEGQILPINVSTSDIDYKTRLNDKMINYAIDVEFAYGKINNIR
jgi:hypothetical protein